MWWDVAAAFDARPDLFVSTGIYLFGSNNEPLCVGDTLVSFKNRLRNRYIGGEYSQCRLAADYEREFRSGGIDAVPDKVETWCRNHNKMVRLRQAAEFAKRGSGTIWVALILVIEKDVVEELKQRLIPVADEWNVKHGFPRLLNSRHME